MIPKWLQRWINRHCSTCEARQQYTYNVYITNPNTSTAGSTADVKWKPYGGTWTNGT